jgi:beta-lactamase class A
MWYHVRLAALTILTGVLLACTAPARPPAHVASPAPSPAAAPPGVLPTVPGAEPAASPSAAAAAHPPPAPPHATTPPPPEEAAAQGGGAATPTSTPVHWPPTASLDDRPLTELAPAAAAYLATRAGPVGVAVVVPSRNAVYTANGDRPFHMASVAKVAILLAVLDQTLREERDLTPAERVLLEDMITVSDNAAATVLWDQLGGAGGVGAYLSAIGLAGIEANHGDAWGASWASPRAVALLLAKLAGGEVLDPPRRALALQLLSAVTPEQRWGVTAGIPEVVPEGTVIAVKDGWYPAGCGWWVNSAGAVLPGGEQPAYTIAVLTGEQPTLADGIETIEGLSARIHAALHP